MRRRRTFMVVVSNKREKPVNDRLSRQEVGPAGTSMRYEGEVFSRSMAVWKNVRLQARQYRALTVGRRYAEL